MKEERLKTMKRRNYKIYQYTQKSDEGDVICIKAITKCNGRKFEGIAKCHPNDRFDGNIGYELAVSRMRQRLLKYKIKEMKHEYEFINNWVNDLNKKYEKLIAEYDDIGVHMNDIMETLNSVEA